MLLGTRSLRHLLAAKALQPVPIASLPWGPREDSVVYRILA